MRHKIVAMATLVAFATGPPILNFIIEFFKNENVYKLQNSSRPPYRDPIFEKIGKRSRLQSHIMYIGKMCVNSVVGGPINPFILWG